MRKMSKRLARKCIDVLADYAHIELTEDQFSELMLDNPPLNNQLVRFNSPSDTMDRECMMEALAKKLVGRRWPCYGDGREYAEKFYVDFEDAAAKNGYKLLS